MICDWHGCYRLDGIDLSPQDYKTHLLDCSLRNHQGCCLILQDYSWSLLDYNWNLQGCCLILQDYSWNLLDYNWNLLDYCWSLLDCSWSLPQLLVYYLDLLPSSFFSC